MNGAVWTLEWRTALRRRRLFVLNLAIPLLLVLPVALSPAPPAHAAAVYAVLFVLFGVFGSAIPLIRDGASGFLDRIRGTGLPDASHLVQRAGAAALLDTLQLLPALASVVAAGVAGQGSGARAGGLLLPVLAASLLAANLVGVWVAALARSLAEGALFAAVVALLLLHASGVFRTPEAGSAGAAVEAAAPFRALHEALLATVGSGGGGASAFGPAGLGGLVVGTGLLLGLSVGAAPWLMARIGRSTGG